MPRARAITVDTVRAIGRALPQVEESITYGNARVEGHWARSGGASIAQSDRVLNLVDDVVGVEIQHAQLELLTDAAPRLLERPADGRAFRDLGNLGPPETVRPKPVPRTIGRGSTLHDGVLSNDPATSDLTATAHYRALRRRPSITTLKSPRLFI